MDKLTIANWFKRLQDEICNGLEQLDGAKFKEDLWEREGGGGGRTRIIEGDHIEKGGVNFSAVHGQLDSKMSKVLNIDDTNFYATGVSIVLHPVNPFVPIIHMNVRYFETGDGTWWFGGGIDVTPHYVNMEDAKFFHNYLKSVCDKTNENYYSLHKKWADDYFYIKHRQETRGIGGIFFDKLDHLEGKKEDLFNYVKNVGQSFLPIYQHLFLNNYKAPYDEGHKEWQFLRRGRYVEFNLVWDRGTKFGLQTGGRIESILMSLPKHANWYYNHVPIDGTPEAFTLSKLVKNINWI